MQKPVCVKCNVEFRPEEIGIYVIEMCHKNQDIYKIWCADIWRCSICRAKIVFGFGNGPIMSHDEDLNKKLSELKSKGRTIVYNYEVQHLDVKWDENATGVGTSST